MDHITQSQHFKTHFESPILNTLTGLIEAWRIGAIDLDGNSLQAIKEKLVIDSFGGYSDKDMTPIKNRGFFYTEIFGNPRRYVTRDPEIKELIT